MGILNLDVICDSLGLDMTEENHHRFKSNFQDIVKEFSKCIWKVAFLVESYKNNHKVLESILDKFKKFIDDCEKELKKEQKEVH